MSDIGQKNSLNVQGKGSYTSENDKEINGGAPKSFHLRRMVPHNVKASDSWDLSMIQRSLIVKSPEKADKTSSANRR